jgi:hypothetical protein
VYKKYLQEKLKLQDCHIGILDLRKNTIITKEILLMHEFTYILCDEHTLEIIKETIQDLHCNSLELHIGYELGNEHEIIEQINIFGYSYKYFDTKMKYSLLLRRLTLDL